MPSENEKTRAVVLIRTDVSSLKSVYDALNRVEAITFKLPVMGAYDIVIVISADNEHELGNILLAEIRNIPGVIQTLTMKQLVIDEGGMT